MKAIISKYKLKRIRCLVLKEIREERSIQEKNKRVSFQLINNIEAVSYSLINSVLRKEIGISTSLTFHSMAQTN